MVGTLLFSELYDATYSQFTILKQSKDVGDDERSDLEKIAIISPYGIGGYSLDASPDRREPKWVELDIGILLRPRPSPRPRPLHIARSRLRKSRVILDEVIWSGVVSFFQTRESDGCMD